MSKGRSTLGHISGQSNMPLSRPAHALSWENVKDELCTNPLNGLTSEEAQTRLGKFGANELGETAGVQPFKIVIAQIANAMTLVQCTISPHFLVAVVADLEV